MGIYCAYIFLLCEIFKQHTSFDRTPFTYLIGWSDVGLYYYGVRFKKGCHPSDLWTRYHTSSRLVKDIRQEWCEPDVIEIREVFDDVETAQKWETKVLKRMNVLKRQGTWLNGWVAKSTTFEASAKGGRKGGNTSKKNKSGIHAQTHEDHVRFGIFTRDHKLGFFNIPSDDRQNARSRGGKNSLETHRKNGTGIFDKEAMKFVREKGQRAMVDAIKIPVMVNDIEYPSMAEAANALDIKYTTIRKRFLSQQKKFENYMIIQGRAKTAGLSFTCMEGYSRTNRAPNPCLS